MGSFISTSLDANMKKQQDFMLDTQKLQVERQLLMQNLMFERQAAMQIGKARDITKYLSAALATVVLGSAARLRQTNNSVYMLPAFPLIFLITYFADMGYGSKMERIRADAEDCLLQNRKLLALPLGCPTYQEIEDRRAVLELDDKLRPNDLFL